MSTHPCPPAPSGQGDELSIAAADEHGDSRSCCPSALRPLLAALAPSPAPSAAPFSAPPPALPSSMLPFFSISPPFLRCRSWSYSSFCSESPATLAPPRDMPQEFPGGANSVAAWDAAGGGRWSPTGEGFGPSQTGDAVGGPAPYAAELSGTTPPLPPPPPFPPPPPPIPKATSARQMSTETQALQSSCCVSVSPDREKTPRRERVGRREKKTTTSEPGAQRGRGGAADRLVRETSDTGTRDRRLDRRRHRGG